MRALLEAAALFAVCAALFAFVQFGAGALADNDGYYHMKMGLLIRQQGLTPPFIWLPMSILSPAAFYDHHMLFHVYLALFAGDGRPESLIAGAKIASIIMPALACVAIWWLLRGQGVRWPALWALALFGLSDAFLYRMSMPRAHAASLLVLALGLHWLLQRRYLPLIPLGFVYVWLYNAFPLLLALAVVYAAAVLLAERRIEWRAPACAALGLVVNLYFPENIVFIITHHKKFSCSPVTFSPAARLRQRYRKTTSKELRMLTTNHLRTRASWRNRAGLVAVGATLAIALAACGRAATAQEASSLPAQAEAQPAQIVMATQVIPTTAAIAAAAIAAAAIAAAATAAITPDAGRSERGGAWGGPAALPKTPPAPNIYLKDYICPGLSEALQNRRDAGRDPQVLRVDLC